MKKEIKVGFLGNPNCGKTTLFNAFTGAKLKVANWPGVTVEKKEGEAKYKDWTIKLIDLPGIYSLSSYSIEEKVSRNCILNDEVDVIINVVDAAALERNLYLTLQLLELGKPVVMALNMMDIIEERGMEIDLHRMPEVLGNIPVVPVSARKRTGLDVLLHAVVHHYQEESEEYSLKYSQEIENEISKIKSKLVKFHEDIVNPRWHAIKLLEGDEEVKEKYADILKNDSIIDYEKKIINEKYNYIEDMIQEVLFNKESKSAFTDKVDEVLTHKIWGIPIFLGIMGIVFFLTFFIGDLLKGRVEILIGWFSDFINNYLISIGAANWLKSMIVDGIIAGVGGILTFLPNIFILFLALALLEDSGYMARVAYIMDGIMGKAGLSGKAFLPMVLGFGCSVPAVMATRSLENERDRKKTILLTPFMSCSAKLPIYILFANMFFKEHAMLVAFSLYVWGVVIAVILALIIGKVDKIKNSNTLLIELPEYKQPNVRTIGIYVWNKIEDYLTKAGTTIFIASIIMWFILNFNMNGMTEDVTSSFGAMLGKGFGVILAPAGLGMWQVAVALIAGLSAKEVVVSSFYVLFGIGSVSEAAGYSQLILDLNQIGFGAVNAYSLMIFSLLYTPCIATIATIKKESNSLRYTVGVVLLQLFVAWLISVIFYQTGRILF
ncbi:ferrous iron transport protein B [Anaerosacchariphilus polymeriproducens]|uniref:Ferrous iron transport protein B n=1 Tax=Anaerosacchariphilus polymeriproducens TaxID=1812858 RepID=A0A371AXF8_9FIRM|nr:ferrous iron transport protein B [Anaerosacchariphilus polymeriproducens]RDU24265.1 ferrous iron transport protein B [Anaerosacchariphilus polymeriproducens]